MLRNYEIFARVAIAIRNSCNHDEGQERELLQFFATSVSSDGRLVTSVSCRFLWRMRETHHKVVCECTHFDSDTKHIATRYTTPSVTVWQVWKCSVVARLPFLVCLAHSQCLVARSGDCVGSCGCSMIVNVSCQAKWGLSGQPMSIIALKCSWLHLSGEGFIYRVDG